MWSLEKKKVTPQYNKGLKTVTNLKKSSIFLHYMNMKLNAGNNFYVFLMDTLHVILMCFIGIQP